MQLQTKNTLQKLNFRSFFTTKPKKTMSNIVEVVGSERDPSFHLAKLYVSVISSVFLE